MCRHIIIFGIKSQDRKGILSGINLTFIPMKYELLSFRIYFLKSKVKTTQKRLQRMTKKFI